MGGIGSGASRFRRIAEESKRIDIREFRKRGYLNAPSRFTWAWTCAGESSGSVRVSIDPGALNLAYMFRIDDEWHSIDERFPLLSRPCNFGGVRYYAACARCTRSVEVLYFASGRFRCRKCARVGYGIENLEKQWRADRRYRQLKALLDEDGSKPARMRWVTYHRICARLEAYGDASESGLARSLRRLLRKLAPDVS
jgi:hypothetical protein